MSRVPKMQIVDNASILAAIPSSDIEKMPFSVWITGFCAVLKNTSLSISRPLPAKWVSLNSGGQTAGSASASTQPLREARSQATSFLRLVERVSLVTTTVSLNGV